MSASWQSRFSFDDILGKSAALQRAIALARRCADSGYPTVLIGETGTGKELFAHAIHSAGPRAGGPFVAVNCGTLSKELAVAELCGSEPGAFTGADRTTRHGLFDAANEGTLFLDELQDMPGKPQSVLLRFSETGHFVRVGGTRPVQSSVRIIAALNLGVEEIERRALVRSDLLYRLNYVTIEIPPLRERRQDIRPIGERVLRQDLGFLGPVDEAVWATLTRCPYAWPGNAREIRNVLLRTILTAPGDELRADDLPSFLWGDPAAPNGEDRANREGDAASPRGGPGGSPDRGEGDRALRAVLRACDNNISEVARRLGVHRSTVYRRLERAGEARLRGGGANGNGSQDREL